MTSVHDVASGAPPSEVSRRTLRQAILPPRWRRQETFAAVGVGLALVLGVGGLSPLIAGGAALFVSVLYVFRAWLFTWSTMLLVLAAIIMFVPVRRYAFPIPLDFALEPYRVIIAVLLVAVVVALLGKRWMPRAPVPFRWPIVAFVVSLVISFAANIVPLTESGLVGLSAGDILQMVFLLSLAIVVRQILTREQLVHMLITFIVWAGVVVAFFAVVERLAKVNVFLLLHNFLPLILLRDEGESLRAGGGRSYASSQHPIALAVMLCMVIPLALYLAAYATKPRYPVTRKIVYGLAVVVLLAGIMTAVSRTAVVVLVVMFLLALALRPRLAILLGLAALPMSLLAAAVQPKVFESMVLSFLDVDGLIESQYASPGFRGQGRLADLAPAMEEFLANPIFGTGPGSRIVVGPDANSYILDNQVLSTLLQVGVIGVLGLAILMLVPTSRLLWRSVRPEAEPRYAFLGLAIATSMTGYIAAMFLYDAFSFIQNVMLLMVLFAIGGWLLDKHLPRPGVVLEPSVEQRRHRR